MSAQPLEIDRIDWKRTFPWTRLFRVVRTAIDLRMLFLGCAALVALVGGDWLFSFLPFAPTGPTLESAARWDQPVRLLRPAEPAEGARDPLALPDALVRHPLEQLSALISNWGVVLRPVRTVAIPVHTILRADASWSQKAFAWTRLLWAMCVWAVAAGAMTRIAAVEQTRETKISLFAAVRFSLENFLSYMTAVFLPIVGILIFWILCTLGGLVGRIPYAGPPLLALVWGLELVFGFIMALILIGAAAGWPLMYATISTEASDGFDGFSRAYSYVFSRPWHYLWYALVAMVYGVIVVTFVYFVVWLVAYMTAAAVASGLGVAGTQQLLSQAAESVGGPDLLTGVSSEQIGIGTRLVGAWLQILALLASGFVTSYFWTASTVIYLLLRYVDDATDFQEVYLAEEKETDELLPLVGVAASDQPISERPPQGDFAAGTNAPPELQPPGLSSKKNPLATPIDPAASNTPGPG